MIGAIFAIFEIEASVDRTSPNLKGFPRLFYGNCTLNLARKVWDRTK